MSTILLNDASSMIHISTEPDERGILLKEYQ